MGVYLTGLHLIGVHLVGVHPMGMQFMGVISRACTLQVQYTLLACTS
jgi:hypothetical protein